MDQDFMNQKTLTFKKIYSSITSARYHSRTGQKLFNKKWIDEE
jgi:hypothetical protein